MFENENINEGRKGCLTVCYIQNKAADVNRAPKNLDEKMYLWFWEPRSLSFDCLSIQLPQRWLQAFTTYRERILGRLWPSLAQALPGLTLLTCSSRSALPSWLSPLSVRASLRRPDRRLFRPARRARASSTASHRVGLTCFTFLLLPAAPNKADWNKLRGLPKGRHRMNLSFL